MLQVGDLESIRRKRVAEMKNKIVKIEEWKQKGHGVLFKLNDKND